MLPFTPGDTMDGVAAAGDHHEAPRSYFGSVMSTFAESGVSAEKGADE